MKMSYHINHVCQLRVFAIFFVDSHAENVDDLTSNAPLSC